MARTNPILEQTLKAMAEITGSDKPDAVSDDNVAVSQRGFQGSENGIAVSLKGTGYLGVDSEPVGSALNPQRQMGLFHKIRKSAGWARFISFKPVHESTGILDLWDDNNFRMHSTAGEGPRTGIPLHKPDISQMTYSTRTLSGAFGLRLKAIKAAQNAGQDVNMLVQQGIAAGIGNVLMDIGLNGDTSLPSDSSENKMRRTVNGWLSKIRTSGRHYQSSGDGASYHNRIWAGMLQQIDETYRSDPGLAWGGPDSLGTRWLEELTAMRSNPSNSHPSIINEFGAALLNSMGNGANPLGKRLIVLPQLTSQGHGDEGYAGIAPTSVTNNGDGTLTVNVNTLCDSGTDRSSTGSDGQRYITIGRVSTGVEETLAVNYSAPNNSVSTTTTLGQSVVSTTASDYYVKWSDLTSLFLGVYRYLALIVQNGIRIYTTFHPRDETMEILVHADIDYMVVDSDAMCLVDGIIAPRFSIFE